MNTQENNQLIAEFMGMTYGDPNDDSVMIQMTPKGNEVVPIELMEYHTSWDWLMSVVDKINDLNDDWGNTNDFTIGNGFVWVDPHIGDRIFFSGNNPEDKKEPMISKVYRGAVKFIEQYTITQNQDNDTTKND